MARCDSTQEELAAALLSIVDVAGMPDSYWQTDSRVTLARQVLDVPVDGRYSHAHLWSKDTATDESQ
jgi:hypothetical protein